MISISTWAFGLSVLVLNISALPLPDPLEIRDITPSMNDTINAYDMLLKQAESVPSGKSAISSHLENPFDVAHSLKKREDAPNVSLVLSLLEGHGFQPVTTILTVSPKATTTLSPKATTTLTAKATTILTTKATSPSIPTTKASIPLTSKATSTSITKTTTISTTKATTTLTPKAISTLTAKATTILTAKATTNTATTKTATTSITKATTTTKATTAARARDLS